METASTPNETAPQIAPLWKPIPSHQRRVLGVLVEKAKTTPAGYPLTLNALTNGCNQKSNRDPVLELEADDVQDALENLRELKAVGEVHGDGRVPKYRHYMKDWLGVDGTELAVMAELLLRGSQTVGELRARAARMANNQLPDLGALRPVLQALMDKRLVISLTPEGRGQIVTHTLYTEREMRDIKAHPGGSVSSSPSTRSAPQPAVSTAPSPGAAVRQNSASVSESELAAEVSALREEVAQMKKEIEDIWANLR